MNEQENQELSSEQTRQAWPDSNSVRFMLFSIVALIVFYTLFRSEPLPDYFYASDKVGHFIGFFLLFCVARWVVPNRIHTGYILLTLLSLAICSEFLQGSDLLPQRHFSTQDMMANAAGLLFGFGVSLRVVGNRRLKE